ncbi:hypothetical protein ACRAWD_27285 [Caulobacter segnis]
MAFYLIYLAGILALAILPAAREDSWRRVAVQRCGVPAPGLRDV